MKEEEFIATPFHICRALNETNREKAVNLIRTCQRCGEEKQTQADVLIGRTGHCYQIFFECLVCSLRVDIFEKDFYKLEDYSSLLSSKQTSSQDVDLRTASGYTSQPTTNGKPKIQILLNKKPEPQPVPPPTILPTMGEKPKIMISLGTKRPLPVSSFEEEEPSAFKQADETFAIKKIMQSTGAQLAEDMRKSAEAERTKRLKKQAVRMQQLMKLKEKNDRSQKEEEQLLATVLPQHNGRPVNGHDWATALKMFRDPKSPTGYDIEKIVQFCRLGLKSTNSATEKVDDDFAYERARAFLYKHRSEYCELVRASVTAAFEEDVRTGVTPM